MIISQNIVNQTGFYFKVNLLTGSIFSIWSVSHWDHSINISLNWCIWFRVGNGTLHSVSTARPLLWFSSVRLQALTWLYFCYGNLAFGDRERHHIISAYTFKVLRLKWKRENAYRIMSWATASTRLSELGTKIHSFRCWTYCDTQTTPSPQDWLEVFT